MLGPNPVVPQHGQHKPQLWAGAAAETMKIAVKSIRTGAKGVKDCGIEMCVPRGLL